MRHHPSILRDPDETPEDPDAPDTGDKSPAEGVVNELELRLFKGRKVMVFGQITDKLARDVVSRVLALVDESAKPIQIYVNSPGGHVESGDSIHDIIKFVRSTVPIYMIGTGWVASAGALIYLAGEKKTRFCLPNTRFLLHQPMGGARGPATDIEIEARELIKMHERLIQIIATETGQSVDESARTPTGTTGCRRPRRSSTASRTRSSTQSKISNSGSGGAFLIEVAPRWLARRKSNCALGPANPCRPQTVASNRFAVSPEHWQRAASRRHAVAHGRQCR